MALLGLIVAYDPGGFLSLDSICYRDNVKTTLKVWLVQCQDPDVKLILQNDIVMCFIYNTSAMSWRYHSNIGIISEFPLGRTSLPAAFCCWSTGLTEREIPMQYYAITEMYTDKCMESQICNDCTYSRNSVSEVLSEDVMLSIYFHFKVLNTL